jgi:glycine/D-amino acid oxidase-like deaminating enzyme/nitrite reductase/ring-hydroxylating ferredoxin subunit
MDTTSYWIDSASAPLFPKLDSDLRVDVAVIGGGIAGLTAAYLLKRAGKTVAVLERGRLASIDTGHTTAHLTSVTDLRLHEIARAFGKEAARATWDAGAAGIDQIVANIRKEDIACDFRWLPGFLFTPLGEKPEQKVIDELKAEAELARELGITAAYTDAVSFFNLPGIRFHQQALFHPRKYLAALAAKIPGDGSHVFEHSEAGEIEDEPVVVNVGQFKVQCSYLVLATHNPLMGKANMLRATLFQTKLSLYSSYAIGGKLPPGTIPDGLYWDTSDPYYYLRVEPRKGYDYAIFGGEDHKTGQEDDTTAVFERLEKKFLRHVPKVDIDHRWSGQVIESNDGLPFIGEMTDRQFTATGFAGNGMTFGTLAGMMAVDAVLKKKNPWQELFEVHRAKLLGGTWTYLTENKDFPYYLVRDWLGGAEAKSLKAVKPGEGKILNLDGKKVAAHRDASGKVTLCSPICTHLKCIVGWNDAEQTWDCPCHGSRFKPTGEVISGPAEEPLERIPLPAGKAD